MIYRRVIRGRFRRWWIKGIIISINRWKIQCEHIVGVEIDWSRYNEIETVDHGREGWKVGLEIVGYH